MARMCQNDDSEAITSSSKDEVKERLKRGPWTAEEDGILKEHVMQHGEGNWNSVQRISGLARCGKSCRLRWNNHLRPDLKKGSFSKEEEETIIKLHAKLGNKWALMAAQLPGRSDNEIKNFWNARMKKRLRVGLPLYPPNLHEGNTQHIQVLPSTQPHSPPSLSFSSFHSSLYRPQLNELTHSFAANTQQNEANENIFTFPNYTDFPFPYPPHGYSMFNQSFVTSEPHGLDSGAALIESPYEYLAPNQSPTDSTTAVSSHASVSGVYGFMGASSSSMANTSCYEVAGLSPSRINVGILDNLAMEAQSLPRNDILNSDHSTVAENLSHKRKDMATEHDDTMFVQQSGKKLVTEETLEGMSCMDDGLFSFLNNLPSEMTLPGCYEEKSSMGFEDALSNSTDQEFVRIFLSNIANKL